MAKKRITTYPSEMALRTLGESSPAMNQAVECWAHVVRQAVADNAEERARVLAKTLRAMDYAHAWAVIIACQRFWERHETLDLGRDEWWRI